MIPMSRIAECLHMQQAMLIAETAVATHNLDLAVIKGRVRELEADLLAMTPSTVFFDLYVLWPVFEGLSFRLLRHRRL